MGLEVNIILNPFMDTRKVFRKEKNACFAIQINIQDFGSSFLRSNQFQVEEWETNHACPL